MSKRIFLTDKDMAQILEVSQYTIYRMANGFYRKKRQRRDGETKVDIMDVKPLVIGGARRWRLTNVAKILGLTEEELEKRLV